MAKPSIKENFKKNPRATVSLGVLGASALVAVVGSLTGVIEPETAIAMISKLLSALMLGTV